MTFDPQEIFERKHALRRALAARHVFSICSNPCDIKVVTYDELLDDLGTLITHRLDNKET